MTVDISTFEGQIEVIRMYRPWVRDYLVDSLQNPDFLSELLSIQEARLRYGYDRWTDRGMFSWGHIRLERELKEEISDAFNYGGVLCLKTGVHCGKQK